MQFNWYKVNFSEEEGEFDRLAGDISEYLKQEDEFHNSLMTQMQTSYRSVRPTTLTNRIWSRVQNTDSWYTGTMNDINRVIKQNAASSGRRDIYNVIKELVSGRIRCPIIYKFSESELINKFGLYTLVGGNTRLMACNLLGIQPKVIIIEQSFKLKDIVR